MSRLRRQPATTAAARSRKICIWARCAGGGVARRAFQKLDGALKRVAAIGRLDGLHVGDVDPVEAAEMVARPGGTGHDVEHRSRGVEIGGDALVALAEDARSSRRSPATSRMRITAHPATARPSVSRWRPARLVTTMRKASPRSRSRHHAARPGPAPDRAAARIRSPAPGAGSARR